jgi:hypothetical protein
MILFKCVFTYVYILWGKYNIRQLFIEAKLRMRKVFVSPVVLETETFKVP